MRDAWLRDVLGPCTVVADLTRQVGSVVEVHDRHGTPWVVKTAPTPGAFDREQHAYAVWVPHLADQAPRLLAAHPDSRTLVLERVPGEADWSWDPARHREAGRLLRRLHDAPPGGAPDQAPGQAPGQAPDQATGVGLGRLMHGRLDAALRRMPAGTTVDPALVAAAERAVGALKREHAALPRVPVHGDFGGHNWVRGPDRLRVVDFADARLAPAALDFARLWVGPWWERPDLADAFFEGYGRPMTAQEHEAVRLQLPVFALSLVSHGARHGDREMERRGRHRLARAVQGADHTAYPTGPRGLWWAARRARDRRRFTRS